MSDLMLMGISITVGAVIGCVTNAVAIMMLFRPYEPIMIGSFKLPFTPGLVPKRRAEIASQLGKIVRQHLIKPERIREKLLNVQLQKYLEAFILERINSFLHSGVTLRKLINDLSIPFDKEKILKKLITSKKEEWKEKNIAQLLGDPLIERVDGKLEDVSSRILLQLKQYMESEEGKEILNDTIQKMIASTGMLSSMISMFLGNIDLTSKVQQELLKLINRDTTKQFVTGALEKEWNTIKDMQIKEVFEYIGDIDGEKQVLSFLDKALSIDTILDTPIAKFVQPFMETIETVMIPKTVSKGIALASSELPRALEFINIESLVEEEVNAFSLPELEKIIVSVTKRELKAITYLGGVLGGLIGLLQGLFYYFF